MTPHSVMGGIKSVIDMGHVGHFHPEMLMDALQTVPVAMHFDFGHTRPLLAHCEFGHTMLEKGLFRLPYDTVFFTASCIPKTAIVMRQEIDGDHLKRLHWFTCAPVVGRDDLNLDVPSLWGELVCEDDSHDFVNHGRVNWKSITTSPHKSRTTGRTWEDKDYHEAAEKVLNFVEGAVALMMSKDVERHLEPAPDRLNKQRIAKGRFPVSQRFVIKIRAEVAAAYRMAARDDGSDHALPRLHFRRGHYRDLGYPRQRDGEQIIPVAPTIINATEDGRLVAKKYEVAG